MRLNRFRSGAFLVFPLLLLLTGVPSAAVGGVSGGAPLASPTETSTGTELPRDVSASWWGQASEHLARCEYRITPGKTDDASEDAAAFQAPNRAQNLRTFFGEKGIRVVPRNAGGRDWTWGLELAGYGRAGSVRPAEPGVLSIEGNRAELARDGLTEWFVNDRRGLEHGFTLRDRPDGATGESTPSPLLVRLRVVGDLEGDSAGSAGAVDFKTADGSTVLRYGKLEVIDAEGKTLPSSMSLQDNDLTLRVDDRNARYPVVIDPLVTSPSWSAEGGLADAAFGCSVSGAGDVNGDGYDDVIVGANGYDIGEDGAGAVFVYLGSAEGLPEAHSWSANGGELSGSFGCSVSDAGDVNGDTYDDVIVGDHSYTSGENVVGAAFVYLGSAEGLPETYSWSAEGSASRERFGLSVSGAGDVNGDTYDDVIIGASMYTGTLRYSGAAYVYHGSASGLPDTPDWTVEGTQMMEFLGVSVAAAGDVNGDTYDDVIVGANRYSNGENYEGAAFVHFGSASGLSATADWSAESNQENAGFGEAVGDAGDFNGDGYSDVIVAATTYTNGEDSEGAAFVYFGSAAGPSASADWMAEGNQAGSRFGWSVGSAGDVNGDGYDEVIVGAQNYASGEDSEGAAFVYHGSAAGPSTSPDWTAQGNVVDSNFGGSVSSAGDVNGDGYADAIIGASGYTNVEDREGAAYVYFGSKDDSGDERPIFMPAINALLLKKD